VPACHRPASWLIELWSTGMPNATPNVALIKGLEGAQNVGGIVSILTDFGISFVVDVINWLMGIEGSYLDRACIIDFLVRHDGLMSLDSVKRALNNVSYGLCGQRTNKCSKCRWLGHNANHCPN